MSRCEEVLGAKFNFGLDNETIIAKLESIAEGIRAKRILPQAIECSTKNAADEFELVTLTLTFAEPVKDKS